MTRSMDVDMDHSRDTDMLLSHGQVAWTWTRSLDELRR
jgi:hypothetical protein